MTFPAIWEWLYFWERLVFNDVVGLEKCHSVRQKIATGAQRESYYGQ